MADRPEPRPGTSLDHQPVPVPGRDPSADIAAARRGVATFDAGDEPGVGDAVRGFTRRYGWRAYALPILVIITIVALMTVKDPSAGERGTSAAPTTAQPSSTGASNPPAASDTTVHSESASPNSVPLNALSLPPGAPYTKSGEGTYSIVKGTTKPFGHSSTGKIWTYDIEVEKGVTGIDVAQFAALVDQTLADPRSWSGHGVELQRVDSGTPDFRVSMTSAFTVRKYCGYTIKIETSCYAAAGSVSGLAVNRVVFDDARWVRGAPSYIADLTAYRTYMINHEDGHALGHMHAHECLADGLAPAMMQQTIGLKTPSGKLCEANPWPYPQGAKDAPGAEAVDTRQNNEYYLQGGE